MMKFGTVAAIACSLTLSLWANPAQAQLLRDGSRGGIFARGYRGENRGIFRGGYYASEEGTTGTVGSRRLFRNRMMGSNRRLGSYEAGYVPVTNVGANAGPTFVYGSDLSATTVGSVASTLNGQPRRSFYAPPENGNQATIEVLLPDAKARIMFDDTKTEETGTDRLFTSPALNPGKTYTYTIKAKWMDKDEEVVRTADVRVQAGRATLVDFRGKGEIRELKGPLP